MIIIAWMIDGDNSGDDGDKPGKISFLLREVKVPEMFHESFGNGVLLCRITYKVNFLVHFTK